jgi:hypothetical protein
MESDRSIRYRGEGYMEKARRPHVIRTWTVERTKIPYRPPQPAKLPHDTIWQRRGVRPPVSPPRKSN